MAPGKSTELKVGIVTILSIILFIVGISLGTGIDVSANFVDIKFRFENSAGIKQSDPIVVNGVERGYVTSVKNYDGSVLITGKINKVSDLYDDLVARITMLEITGGKKIEITPGKSKISFEPENTIPGVQTSDFGNLLLLAGELATDLRGLLQRLDTVAAAANTLFADGQVVRDIKYSVGRSVDIVDDIYSIVRSNKANLNTSLKNLRYISERLRTAIDRNEPKIDTLITDLQETITITNSLLKKVDGTAGDADKLIQELISITDAVKNGDGFVSKLLYDKELSDEVSAALQAVQILVDKIEEHGINVNVRLGTRP